MYKIIEIEQSKDSNDWKAIILGKQEYTSICVKSAPPTPTMRIDSGRSDALTKVSLFLVGL